MFDNTAIERKEFSVDLPMIIHKIALVAEVIRLYKATPEKTELEDIHLAGVCSVLLEIESDLTEINKALYGTYGYEYHYLHDGLEKMRSEATESLETAT